jgi:serine/threonine protein kinase
MNNSSVLSNDINRKYIKSSKSNEFGKKYRLIEKIGNGSFGEVYIVKDRRTHKEYACKFEEKNDKQRLKHEVNIYKILKKNDIRYVPRIYSFYSMNESYAMVMKLLGKSLTDVLEDANGILDLGTVMKMGYDITHSMEKIHNTGIIHRDIKPDNFMFGCDENRSRLYVMDFGLSKLWLQNDKHINFKKDRSMIGTARYASLNIHKGFELSRRDDIESIGYLLVYLAKGRLPWQGLKHKNKTGDMKKSGMEAISDKKHSTSLKILCDELPECFSQYIKHARDLKFNEKPNYDYLKRLIISSSKKYNIKLKYHWC